MAIVITKLLVALLTGITSAFGGVSAPSALLMTGVLMVVIAAEAMSERKEFRIVIALCATGLGLISGHWWGFLALSCVAVPPIPGGLAAA